MSESAFGHWLAGLIDGEGCFRIQYRRSTETYACVFSLKLRDDDDAILQQVQAATGLGRLQADHARGGRSKPCLVWIVDTKEDCIALCELLAQHPLRTRKARDLVVWKEAVEFWSERQKGNRWHGAGDWEFLREAKRRLQEARTYAGREVVQS